MVSLPPYLCELNPTERVFQVLLARLDGERKRYNATSNNEFVDDIDGEEMQFNRRDVKSFFDRCGCKQI